MENNQIDPQISHLLSSLAEVNENQVKLSRQLSALFWLIVVSTTLAIFNTLLIVLIIAYGGQSYVLEVL